MHANFDVVPVNPNMPIREGKRFTFANEAAVVELKYVGFNIQAIITNNSDFDLVLLIGDKQGRGIISNTQPSKAPVKIITFPLAMKDMKEVDLELTVSIQPKRNV